MMFDRWRSGFVPETAVCLHVSYPSFAVEILKRLEAISAPFTLIVSYSDAFPEALSEKLEEIRKVRVVEIHQEPHIGFDILPFLYLLPHLMKFDIVCKLHTVRIFESGVISRNSAVETLIGSDADFRKIVRYFAQNDKIGMMGPADVYISPYSLSENDRGDMYALMAEFAPNEVDHEWGFFAGTMFWARTEMLSPIANLAMNMEVAFCYEDREMAHAVEPLFGLLPTLQNRDIAVLEVTDDGLKVRCVDDVRNATKNRIRPSHLKLYTWQTRVFRRFLEVSHSAKSRTRRPGRTNFLREIVE